MTTLLLCLVAVLESVVMLWRIRAGVGGSAFQAGASASAMCATRVLWLNLGVAAALEGRALVAGLAYCLSAGAATWMVHGMKGKR
jgi:hypothetical protein